MGKAPVRLKEVVYTLSPFEQSIMPGLFKDFPQYVSKKVSENWFSSLFLTVPVFGTYAYAENYVEQAKLAHRY